MIWFLHNNQQHKSRMPFELTRVLVRLNHIARIIVNANHCTV